MNINLKGYVVNGTTPIKDRTRAEAQCARLEVSPEISMTRDIPEIRRLSQILYPEADYVTDLLEEIRLKSMSRIDELSQQKEAIAEEAQHSLIARAKLDQLKEETEREIGRLGGITDAMHILRDRAIELNFMRCMR